MSLSRLKTTINKHLINSIGWKNPKRYIVLESDDWGSIRMPSKEAYQQLLDEKLVDPEHPFARLDAPASEVDLQRLFTLLSSIKDHTGKHPVLTANCVVANPDFSKIRESGFLEYFCEPVTETLQRYPEHAGSFELWKTGIKEGLFYPQLHGREHVNVRRWMELLASGKKTWLKAFDLGTWYLKPGNLSHKSENIAAAMDFDKEEDSRYLEDILTDAADRFEDLFGFRSSSFIAPNYIWHPTLEVHMKSLGIKFLQGTKFQNIPETGKEGYSRRFRFTGMKSREGMINLVRNCFFEPALNKNIDSIGTCLQQIEAAFMWKKPAVISTHRINYSGYFDPANRDNNLTALKALLSEIMKKWPDAEFLTSPQLGAYIEK